MNTKKECEHTLSEQCHARSGARLEHIGRQLTLTCDTAEIETGHHVDEPAEDARADGSTEQLCHNIAHKILEAHAAADPYRKRYRRIDVASRDVAYRIDQAHKHKAETQTYAKTADRRTGQHCAAAGQEHEKHCADAFRKILIHNRIN